MDASTDIEEISPKALKDSIRLGSIAWILFALGLVRYVFVGGGGPLAFSLTGFIGYMFGLPFAIGGLWTAVSKRQGMLESRLSAILELAASSSDDWKLAAGINGVYVLLFVAYLVVAFWGPN